MLLRCLQLRSHESKIRYINESSSSCRAASTDIPDPHLPLLPIVHIPTNIRTNTSDFTSAPGNQNSYSAFARHQLDYPD